MKNTLVKNPDYMKKNFQKRSPESLNPQNNLAQEDSSLKNIPSDQNALHKASEIYLSSEVKNRLKIISKSFFLRTVFIS